MRGLLPLLLSADAQHLIMSMGGVPYLLSPDATGAAACRTVAEPDCAGMVDLALEDLRDQRYYAHVAELQRHLAARGVWVDMMEGHTGTHHAKVRFLRKVAEAAPADPLVCEVGFNAGHSALSWLLARPDSRVLSVDVGNLAPSTNASDTWLKLYSRHAADHLYERFPGRFALVLGDSTAAVPALSGMLWNAGSRPCDVIFLDGGHDEDVLRADFANFAPLAKEAWNRVVVDDLGSQYEFQRTIASVWGEAVANGTVLELGRAASTHSACISLPLQACWGDLASQCDCGAAGRATQNCCEQWCAAPATAEVDAGASILPATRDVDWSKVYFWDVPDGTLEACANGSCIRRCDVGSLLEDGSQYTGVERFPMESEIVSGSYVV